MDITTVLWSDFYRKTTLNSKYTINQAHPENGFFLKEIRRRWGTLVFPISPNKSVDPFQYKGYTYGVTKKEIRWLFRVVKIERKEVTRV
jgi:hypothetical protein